MNRKEPQPLNRGKNQSVNQIQASISQTQTTRPSPPPAPPAPPTVKK